MVINPSNQNQTFRRNVGLYLDRKTKVKVTVNGNLKKEQTAIHSKAIVKYFKHSHSTFSQIVRNWSNGYNRNII